MYSFIYMKICSISCLLSAVLIISMIYFHNATSKSRVVEDYKKSLPVDLKMLYEKITRERLQISYTGYVIGLLFSFLLIAYNYSRKDKKWSNTSIVCIVIIVSYFTNYFYYILSPKTTYMLEHISREEENKKWLKLYRYMQFHHHFGLLIGILAVGIFAFAFRNDI